ncbi:hypothetical protein EI291_07010 [Hymenobacter rigui]|uniref:Transposase n=1 Tax=Hymenobacter rigui TaxID=334424 RepID=A0A3R9MUG6_9BACT|nr:hypothetical protein EI291_07010 [Hymenobacter rigui]
MPRPLPCARRTHYFTIAWPWWRPASRTSPPWPCTCAAPCSWTAPTPTAPWRTWSSGNTPKASSLWSRCGSPTRPIKHRGSIDKVDRRRTYLSPVTAAKTTGPSPDTQCTYDDAFKAGALRLASESRSTQAAARKLGISPELLYRWQQAQVVAEVGNIEVAVIRRYAPCARPSSSWLMNWTVLKKPSGTSPSAKCGCPCVSSAACCTSPPARTTPDVCGRTNQWPCAKR